MSVSLQTNVNLETAFHYDVKWKLPFKREVRNSDKPLLWRAFELAKAENMARDFKINPQAMQYNVIFDGRANAYSTKPLPFKGEYVTLVDVPEDEESGCKNTLKIELRMTFACPVDVSSAVLEFCRRGRTSTRPNDAISVVNTLLGHIVRADKAKMLIGRSSAFSLAAGKGRVLDIGGGKALWIGTFSSFRPAWKPFLNVDVRRLYYLSLQSAYFFSRWPISLATKKILS